MCQFTSLLTEHFDFEGKPRAKFFFLGVLIPLFQKPLSDSFHILFRASNHQILQDLEPNFALTQDYIDPVFNILAQECCERFI